METKTDPVSETLFCSNLEFQTMDKVHKPVDAEGNYNPFVLLWLSQGDRGLHSFTYLSATALFLYLN
jgi:hypothetical protein